MIIEQQKLVVLPPGWHKAVVQDVQPTTGQFGDQVQITFLVDGDDGLPVKVKAWASARFSPMSKLYAWAENIFGVPIPESYDLNTDDLLGRACDIKLERRPGAKGEFLKVVAVAKAGTMTTAANGDSDLPF